MYIIPVTPFTLDLIQALNGEVRPVMEAEESFFIFRPHGENTIVSFSDVRQLCEGSRLTVTYYPG